MEDERRQEPREEALPEPHGPNSVTKRPPFRDGGRPISRNPGASEGLEVHVDQAVLLERPDPRREEPDQEQDEAAARHRGEREEGRDALRRGPGRRRSPARSPPARRCAAAPFSPASRSRLSAMAFCSGTDATRTSKRSAVDDEGLREVRRSQARVDRGRLDLPEAAERQHEDDPAAQERPEPEMTLLHGYPPGAGESRSCEEPRPHPRPPQGSRMLQTGAGTRTLVRLHHVSEETPSLSSGAWEIDAESSATATRPPRPWPTA